MEDTIVSIPYDDSIFIHIRGFNMDDFDSVRLVIRSIGYVNETTQKSLVHICKPQKYTDTEISIYMMIAFAIGFLVCLVIKWARS